MLATPLLEKKYLYNNKSSRTNDKVFIVQKAVL